jgi:THO complex subunit 4
MLFVLNLLSGLFMDIVEQGSAEVIFTRRSEALAALKRYNNMRLDGKAMKIEVIGAELGLSAAAVPQISVVPGASRRGQREVVMMYGSSLALPLLLDSQVM